MWDLPGPGLEPVSPALAGGFLTTAPPGKSLLFSVFVFAQLPGYFFNLILSTTLLVFYFILLILSPNTHTHTHTHTLGPAASWMHYLLLFSEYI